MSYGRIPLLIVSLSLGICPVTVSAQVYKWVDAEGNVHYGQSRPPGEEAEALEVKPPNVSAEQRALELEKLKLKARLGSENQEPQSDQAGQATPEMPEAVRRENCRIARHNMASLVQKRRIVRTDEGGNLVRLDDAEREARLQEAKEQVEKFCN